MADIGYNDGIEAFETWFRKFSAFLDAYNTWVEEFKAWRALPVELQQTVDPPTPPSAPKIRLEGPLYDPKNQSTWPWVKNFFDNTMRKLKDSHDAANDSPQVPPKPPDPPPVDPTPVEPWNSGYPPLAYNSGTDANNSGSGKEPGARYNIRINCTQVGGEFVDKHGNKYDDGGRTKGGRTENYVPGLKHANSMDGREPWEPYEHGGVTYGPNKENYPAACYQR